jgi:alkanesulfonate monooxygenase SsuD/methylene tetrahydromethanopterin reductase-like flavin-dependent oxidoreductase (luciferase family)
MGEVVPARGVRRIGIFDHLDRTSDDLGRFYARRRELTARYDALGFYSYHVAEHHSTPLGLAPSPNIFLATVAAHTHRLRLGALVYLLPLYHPLRLIEELCMLDQISGGRLDVGIGRGISPIEASLYGVSPDESQAMFEENAEVLSMGFSGASLTFEGRYHQFNNVPLQIDCVQRPHPPFWYGVSSPDSAARCAERGWNVLTLMPPQQAASVIAAYHAAARSQDLLAGIVRFVVVADSDEEATRIAEPAYDRWWQSFHWLPHFYGKKPVQGDRPRTFSAISEVGLGVAGSPDTVATYLERQIAETGSTYLVCQFAFGDQLQEQTERSTDLFARDVKPRLMQSSPVTR